MNKTTISLLDGNGRSSRSSPFRSLAKYSIHLTLGVALAEPFAQSLACFFFSDAVFSGSILHELSYGIGEALQGNSKRTELISRQKRRDTASSSLRIIVSSIVQIDQSSQTNPGTRPKSFLFLSFLFNAEGRMAPRDNMTVPFAFAPRHHFLSSEANFSRRSQSLRGNDQSGLSALTWPPVSVRKYSTGMSWRRREAA